MMLVYVYIFILTYFTFEKRDFWWNIRVTWQWRGDGTMEKENIKRCVVILDPRRKENSEPVDLYQWRDSLKTETGQSDLISPKGKG